MALSKSLKLANSVPAPHSPSRSMYAMLRTEEAPVAEQYTTRPLGSCS